MVDPDREFGCADGSCPFYSRLGMHTNGGCKCTYEAFPDMATRRLVDRMLVKAREVAAADAVTKIERANAVRERRNRIAEIRRELGRESDKAVIENRRRLREEMKRLELEE